MKWIIDNRSCPICRKEIKMNENFNLEYLNIN